MDAIKPPTFKCSAPCIESVINNVQGKSSAVYFYYIVILEDEAVALRKEYFYTFAGVADA
jgi:hypothetical protein